MSGSRQFTTGDHVHVVSIGQGVVLEVRSGERYLVEVKGRRMLVHAGQLSMPSTPRPRTAPAAVGGAQDVPQPAAASHSSASIDLHGMTTEEAIVALDLFLNSAILANHAVVRVIHGRSGGRLKAAVHRRLRTVTSVRAFRVDPANPGVTLITL